MAYISPDYIHEPLYVVVPIINQIRFKSRWKHYERFVAYAKASGAVIITVEAAFGERHHALAAGETQHKTPIYQDAPTKATEFHKARTEVNHQYIRLRTDDEVWFKENLINIGISRLPEDWKYVAWIDPDVMFARPNWVGETIQQLQHYQLVQMFSESIDVGPRYASIGTARGFMHCFLKGVAYPGSNKEQGGGGYYYPHPTPGKHDVLWHPGYAWAARREAIDALGGLVDFALMGAGDNHMAHALIGKVEDSFHPGVHPNYRKKLVEWQFRAEKHIRHNVGYVSGLLVHYWHGRKTDRGYWKRWRVIVENQFNPETDLKYDWQGMLQLVDRGDQRYMDLRDDARRYFRSRNEDSIELSGTADVE